MAVVVDEFEVVPGAPASQGPAAGPDAQSQGQPPDPIKAEEELERSLRRLHGRAARLHAS